MEVHHSINLKKLSQSFVLLLNSSLIPLLIQGQECTPNSHRIQLGCSQPLLAFLEQNWDLSEMPTNRLKTRWAPVILENVKVCNNSLWNSKDNCMMEQNTKKVIRIVVHEKNIQAGTIGFGLIIVDVDRKTPSVRHF